MTPSGIALFLALSTAFPTATDEVAARPKAETVQQDDDAPTAPVHSDLEESVEVTAMQPAAAEIAAFATTIETRDLVARGQDLAGVLRRVPGARVQEYGGLGRLATVSLRSSTAEQVTVTVDGIPQNRALGGPVDLSFIPATQIDHVTVYRGFAPASAGLAGLGGLVDVRTRPPTAGASTHIDVLAGGLGSTRASVGTSFAAGKQGHLRLGVEGLESDGDFTFLDTRATPFDPSDDVKRRRQNNDVENVSLLLQGTWNEVGGGRLTISGRAQDHERGVPGVDALPSSTAAFSRQLQDLAVAWTWPGSGHLSSVDLTAQAFDEEQRFANRSGDLGLFATDRTTDMQGGGVSALLRLDTLHHHWTGRVDARTERARVRDDISVLRDRGGADRDLVAITVQDLVPLGRLTLAPSLRWEHRSDSFLGAGGGTLPAAAAVVDDEFSGKLGLAYALTGSCSVRGSAGHFFRSPNLLELFGDSGSVRGNPGLSAESGDSYEVGLACEHTHRAARWTVETVAFGRQVDDLIRFLPNSQATLVAANLQAARVIGVEGAFTWQGPRGWSVDASGTWQEAEDDSDQPTHGSRLVFSPSKLGYLSAAWQGARITARWELNYVGNNGIDSFDTPALRLPSRVIHDANVTWEVRPFLRVGLDVRNLFDRQTRDVARFPLPGRTAFVYLGWRFGEATS